jgi:uncharacterized protein (TIGR00290 family)
MPGKRVLLSWSTGKDSAWTLHELRRTPDVDVVGLLTTYNQAFDRVAMHAVRLALLEAQAEAAGVPLLAVPLPWPCSNEAYEEVMRGALAEARARFQPTHVAFGDLYLEDVRRYREERMADTGLELLFPLWGTPTRPLAAEMIRGGLRAFVTCVDPRRLPADMAGRAFDQAFLDALPADVDPCAEAGEFHTFAWAGPMFAHPIPVAVGEILERDGFVFADLTPA